MPSEQPSASELLNEISDACEESIGNASKELQEQLIIEFCSR